MRTASRAGVGAFHFGHIDENLIHGHAAQHGAPAAADQHMRSVVGGLPGKPIRISPHSQRGDAAWPLGDEGASVAHAPTGPQIADEEHAGLPGESGRRRS